MKAKINKIEMLYMKTLALWNIYVGKEQHFTIKSFEPKNSTQQDKEN